jgi:hypothetical protein
MGVTVARTLVVTPSGRPERLKSDPKPDPHCGHAHAHAHAVLLPNSSSKALAAFKSAVSRPLVNQLYMGANRSRACMRLSKAAHQAAPWHPLSRPCRSPL